MECSLAKNELKIYVATQLEHFSPDQYKFNGIDVDKAMELALERVEFCFKHITVAGYNKNNMPYFYHLHADQYSQFLYYLSNSLWKLSENKVLCDKLIYLNRALHSIWFSYKGELPNIFLLTHPVGSVLGNAAYSDFLVVSQNVTVNTNFDEKGNKAPILGKGLFLSAGAKIIGNKPIGDRVTIGIDTCVFKREIQSDRLVYKDENGKIQTQIWERTAIAQPYFNVNIC